MQLKGCYSRPLWPYNQKVYQTNVAADNFGYLLEQQNGQFVKTVLSTLLTRVVDLEEKVSEDVARTKGVKPEHRNRRDTSDTTSQVSSFKPVKRNNQRRFTQLMTQLNPSQLK